MPVISLTSNQIEFNFRCRREIYHVSKKEMFLLTDLPFLGVKCILSLGEWGNEQEIGLTANRYAILGELTRLNRVIFVLCFFKGIKHYKVLQTVKGLAHHLVHEKILCYKNPCGLS